MNAEKVSKMIGLSNDLKKYLENTKFEYFEYEESYKVWNIDATINKANVTLYMADEDDHATLRYDFIDVEIMKEYIREKFDQTEANKLEKELEEKVTQFIENINKTGWKYEYSHPVREKAYAWADAIFEKTKFDEETLNEVTQIISEFDKYNVELHKQVFGE